MLVQHICSNTQPVGKMNVALVQHSLSQAFSFSLARSIRSPSPPPPVSVFSCKQIIYSTKTTDEDNDDNDDDDLLHLASFVWQWNMIHTISCAVCALCITLHIGYSSFHLNWIDKNYWIKSMEFGASYSRMIFRVSMTLLENYRGSSLDFRGSYYSHVAE